MDADEPGLFDLPDRERPGIPERRLRGRNGERWTRTATAEVTIIDAGTLHEAAAPQSAVTIEVRPDPDVEDTEPGTSAVAPGSTAFEALGRLIWPTEGMERPLEAGAFRVLSLDSEVLAESVDRGTITWTVTVKVTDVNELRRLAVEFDPDAAALIADSLEVAWQCAADPFAPLRSIPGIDWRPGQVDVEHLPARAVGNR